MTTIAANRTSIACDQLFSYGATTKMLGKSKVHKLDPELSNYLLGNPTGYVGFAGDASCWYDAKDWFLNPNKKPPKIKNIEFLALGGNKKIFYSQRVDNYQTVDDKFFSIGSGMQYALAAMSLGKTPLEAVKVAAKHDLYTGLGFKEYKL